MANEVRLIDANALVKIAEKRCGVVNIKHIDECLTVDAVEVVHGRWEWYEALVNPYAMCSNCGCGLNKIDALNFTYCPYCGAKMDGGEQ